MGAAEDVKERIVEAKDRAAATVECVGECAAKKLSHESDKLHGACAVLPLYAFNGSCVLTH